MKNSVLNFSLMRPKEVPRNLPLIEVDASLSAEQATTLAESGNYKVIVVKDHGDVVGLLFPEYLLRILPTHHRVVNARGKGLSPGLNLVQMIRQIDADEIDFHSETVNIQPDIWICSGGGGHIAPGSPCPEHNIPATPY